MSYVSLHNHSTFSIRDGVSIPEQMASYAKELGHTAIAITDHGTCSGWRQMRLACDKVGIKCIYGYEAYERASAESTTYNHITLLAKDDTGLQNLIAINNFALGAFDGKRSCISIADLHENGLGCGIICLTGCVSSPLTAIMFKDRSSIYNEETTREAVLAQLNDGWFEACCEYIRRLQAAFDAVYIEIQYHGLAIQEVASEKLRELSVALGVPCVATTDSHYVRPDDKIVQEIILQTDKQKKFYAHAHDKTYIHAGHDITWATQQEIDESGRIAELCTAVLRDKNPDIPKRDDVDVPALCWARLAEIGLDKSQKHVDRLKHELEVIQEFGLTGYFGIVYDYCKFARENDIMYGPRGSATGSIVSFLLQICEQDPLEYDLLFERFINRGRMSPGHVKLPDIDIDFESRRRHLIVNYMKSQYGETNVVNISNYGTMGPSGAVRCYSRIYQGHVNAEKLSSIVGMFPSITDALEDDVAKQFTEEEVGFLRVAAKLEGVISAGSMNACGIVVMQDLAKYFPLRNVSGTITIDFDKDDVEALGGLKFDILGLKELDCLRQMVDMMGYNPFEEECAPVTEVKPTISKLNMLDAYLSYVKSKGFHVENLSPFDEFAVRALFDNAPVDMPNPLAPWRITGLREVIDPKTKESRCVDTNEIVYCFVDKNYATHKRCRFYVQRNNYPDGVMSVATRWVHLCEDGNGGIIWSCPKQVVIDYLIDHCSAFYTVTGPDNYYDVPEEMIRNFLKDNNVRVMRVVNGQVVS